MTRIGGIYRKRMTKEFYQVLNTYRLGGLLRVRIINIKTDQISILLEEDFDGFYEYQSYETLAKELGSLL